MSYPHSSGCELVHTGLDSGHGFSFNATLRRDAVFYIVPSAPQVSFDQVGIDDCSEHCWWLWHRIAVDASARVVRVTRLWDGLEWQQDLAE